MHYICFANSWLAEGNTPMVGATVAVAESPKKKASENQLFFAIISRNKKSPSPRET